VKRFLTPLREDPAFEIPPHFEQEFKELRVISSSSKGDLRFQDHIAMKTSSNRSKLWPWLQHTLDRVQELNTDLYFLQVRWHTHLKESTTWVNKQYFEPLNQLRDGVRKSVISSVLSPIEAGVERVDGLIEVGEKIYSHLIATNWNIKEGSSLIKEYLTSMKIGPLRTSL
jgi:hypothetical protein